MIAEKYQFKTIQVKRVCHPWHSKKANPFFLALTKKIPNEKEKGGLRDLTPPLSKSILSFNL